jgi:hypothetical protein
MAGGCDSGGGCWTRRHPWQPRGVSLQEVSQISDESVQIQELLLDVRIASVLYDPHGLRSDICVQPPVNPL